MNEFADDKSVTISRNKTVITNSGQGVFVSTRKGRDSIRVDRKIYVMYSSSIRQ